MDLRTILNPIPDSLQAREPATTDTAPRIADSAREDNDSQATVSARDDDETISQPSTTSQDDKAFTTPTKHHRRSSDTTVPTNAKPATKMDNPIIISPNKGFLYDRQASDSPTRIPAFSSPARRRRTNSQPGISQSDNEADVNQFSVFVAILNYPELTLEIAKNLDIEDLISLYAISKGFHMLVNTRFTAMIKAQWYGKAYESGYTFIFRCYKSLCMRDPVRRINETRPNEVRFVPSFRWLRMILFREAVVDDIMRSMAREGHRMPRRMTVIIKKIWFTMDIGDNSRRIGLLHNVRFWSSKDLYFATMFFLKLDMRLTNPATGNGELGLRKMLLRQRSLSTLSKVLNREEMRTQLDMLRMIVRFSYEPENHKEMSIMGVPPEEIGKLQYEGWGLKKTKFIGVDELVMREAVRRKLNLQNHYVTMMIWGYINKQRWEDIRTPMPKPAESESSEDEEDDDEEAEQLARESMGCFGEDSDAENRKGGDEGGKETQMDVDLNPVAGMSN
jgi:hypothetical protein